MIVLLILPHELHSMRIGSNLLPVSSFSLFIVPFPQQIRITRIEELSR